MEYYMRRISIIYAIIRLLAETIVNDDGQWWSLMVVYLDDVLVYSKTVEEHVRLLDEVFAIFQKYKLYLKESKCSLFMSRVNFLGHVVSAEGVSLESGKVDVVQKWPVPQKVTHVQQFLGLCN